MKVTSLYGLRIVAYGGEGALEFFDPETGETWTGRGRAPRWLDGKDKEAFRIKN